MYLKIVGLVSMYLFVWLHFSPWYVLSWVSWSPPIEMSLCLFLSAECFPVFSRFSFEYFQRLVLIFFGVQLVRQSSFVQTDF